MSRFRWGVEKKKKSPCVWNSLLTTLLNLSLTFVTTDFLELFLLSDMYKKDPLIFPSIKVLITVTTFIIRGREVVYLFFYPNFTSFSLNLPNIVKLSLVLNLKYHISVLRFSPISIWRLQIFKTCNRWGMESFRRNDFHPQ